MNFLARFKNEQPASGTFRYGLKYAVAGLAGLALASLWPHLAQATDIQEITTEAGITAWLVEDHTVPLIAVEFAFEGGSSQDPAGKEGLVNLLSATLDEGAGDLKARAFQERMEDLVMRLSFDEGRDDFYGSMRTISLNADDAFEMLRLAVTEPRFDEEAVERMKTQLVANLRREKNDPDAIAGRVWSETVFPDHPYGRPSKGTEETVAKLTPDDLRALQKRLFARDNLKVAVVGAIDAETLKPLLDRVFASLPEKADLLEIPDIEPKTGMTETVELNVPQTSIRVGLPGLKRSDPEFIPAFIMNHILGGGAFSSWLYEEVREKRGLAYSVGSYLVSRDHSGMLMAATGTRAEKAAETLSIIEEQFSRMAEEGPTPEELRKAKDYLTGSYALRFDSSSKIANQLVGIQIEDLGIDYIKNRNEMIEEITLDQVKAVARRLLAGKTPTIITVGPNGA
ncbi:insulinase family protein [Rhizobiales bacterium]|uniref:M16 family metallopeptidase n=1 Tax=Hongsoonwoonella zoysiae TaxID=2821844 RepID=UPI00155F966E|nr:pitrilysin family protein [Hongsoonwoonella zoysiae]NRG19843.1 insulinase family protein [Hongsoonwoonella zoysiae]